MDQYRSRLISLALSQDVTINAIGVWDTVGSLGIPVSPMLQRLFPLLPAYFKTYAWYDTRIGRNVGHAFQALALDEHRSPYTPAVWEKPEGCQTVLKQVWFPGSHSNIGGSYENTGLADLTMAWMMDCLSGSGLDQDTVYNVMDWIKFDEDYIETLFQQRLRWHNERMQNHQMTIPFPAWGLGTVYNSSVFPQSLTGRKTRTPGRYHASLLNGRPNPTQLLRNTSESVHASVRVRMEHKGKAPEIDWSHAFPFLVWLAPWFEKLWLIYTARYWPSYRPQATGGPLADWKLKMPDHDAQVVQADTETDFQASWVYDGRHTTLCKVLAEDQLGTYERRLLQNDKAWAKQELARQEASL